MSSWKIRTDERAAGFPLAYKLLGANIFLLECHRTVLDAECADISISIEPLFYLSVRILKKEWNSRIRQTYGIIVDERRQLRVRHDTVESTVDVIGDISMHLQVLNLALESAWFHEV